MFTKKYFLCVFLIFASFCLGKGLIYKVKIDGIIDRGLIPYVERSIESAEQEKADWILFDMNTLGGRVDAAIDLKDMILNSKVPTAVYVNKRAISAGALISLSCQKIIMSEGSSIGATTVVDGKGEKQSEKAQSYMRAEMGSTAERYGRSKEIAQAMVDEDIEIEGITKKGKLLTFTAIEAKEHQFCDSIINNFTDVYTYLGVNSPEVVEVEISAAELIVRFLTNPIVSSLLMTIGFLGMIFEVKTAGWGISGTVAIIALSLFFGSHYIVNMADHLELIMFVAGLILLALEMFVIPGFGIAGISGILLILVSFFMTMIGRFPNTDDLMTAGASISAAFILSVVGTYLIIKTIPESKFFSFLVVKQKHEHGSGVKATASYTELLGKRGICSTDLRLSGKADIERKTYQVISEGSYINKNAEVEVVRVEGNKIIVKECQS